MAHYLNGLGSSFVNSEPSEEIKHACLRCAELGTGASAFKFSCARRMLLQALEAHLNRQDIVYLAKINAIVDYIFTGGLEIPNLMTGIGSHASVHPCAYYISASKSWDPDAPPRLLNIYARHFDKWMKTWRNFFSCPKLDSTKPVMLLSPPPPPPPPATPLILNRNP